MNGGFCGIAKYQPSTEGKTKTDYYGTIYKIIRKDKDGF